LCESGKIGRQSLTHPIIDSLGTCYPREYSGMLHERILVEISLFVVLVKNRIARRPNVQIQMRGRRKQQVAEFERCSPCFLLSPRILRKHKSKTI
jgi:hypothetical protein